MSENQSFIEATNFLKNVKKINFSEQARKLGLKRHTFDSYRGDRLEVREHVMLNLVKIYPETERFMKETTDTLTHPPSLNEPMELYRNGSGNTLKELVETQRKLIERIESENNNLKKRLALLEGENRALKEIITKRS